MAETEGNKFVLIVLFDSEERRILTDALHENDCPFTYEITSSIKETLDVLSQNVVHVIVMTKLEAIFGDDGNNGLITHQKNLPPTVTLIRNGDFPEYLYNQNAINDWVTMPFSLEELYGRVYGVIRRAGEQTS